MERVGTGDLAGPGRSTLLGRSGRGGGGGAMMPPAMSRRATRSISGPIIYGSFAVVLTTALLVGWIYVIVRSQGLTQQWASSNIWLLVAGTVSFTAIIAVLVLFSVVLARSILEFRRQTTFVDSVTHELRSPLASLRLCLETLRRPELVESQRDRLHEMMRNDVDRLAGFIDDILEASRIEHGGRGHAVAAVDVRALVDRCAAQVRRRHGVEVDAVHLTIPDGLVVYTDPTAFEIAIKNLLDNAVKYSDPPAKVELTATDGNGYVRIEVRDHGIGIPRRALRRVFDRFYRVDEEAVRARRGTGLGLFVVRALVRGIGGRLTADSDGPGTGTRMTIVLPQREPTPASRPTPSAGAAPGESPSRP